MLRASSAGCWADDPADTGRVTLDFLHLKHDIGPSNSPIDPRHFSEGSVMTDPNGQKDNSANPAQDTEPVVSKPYIMPDDPEEGSAEALAKEAAELRDKMLRTLAEMENLRKRTSREVADARTYGIAAFARDVLDIADNLQRALDAVPADTKAAADPGLKALIEGVELTERSLLNALEKNGVKKFDPSGEKFDPNFQQAMYEVPDPSVPAGTVVQVVQAGYMIGERVLRPALVAIAKGGAKVAAPANGNPPNSGA
jgi:molecular chaperone GrpE